MKSLKTIVAIVLLVSVIIVVIQNRAPVETKILMATVTMPRALLLAVTLAVGIVAGLILGTRLPSRTKKPE